MEKDPSEAKAGQVLGTRLRSGLLLRAALGGPALISSKGVCLLGSCEVLTVQVAGGVRNPHRTFRGNDERGLVALLRLSV